MEDRLGGSNSNPKQAELAKQEVIAALVASYQERDTISHIDPDLPLFNVTDDYVSLDLWQKTNEKHDVKITKNERINSEQLRNSPVIWRDIFGKPDCKDSYVISAPPGAGKSVLMHHMAATFMQARLHAEEGSAGMADWPFDWVLLLHCRDFYSLGKEQSRSNASLHKIINSLCFQDLSCFENISEEQKAVVCELLTSIMQGGRKTLLLLDGLDELPNEASHIKKRLLKKFPCHVISGRPHAVSGYLSNNNYGMIEISGFSNDSQNKYMADYANKKKLNPAQLIRMQEILAVQHGLLTELPIILDIFCYLASDLVCSQQVGAELSGLDNLSEWYDCIVTKLIERYYFQRKKIEFSNDLKNTLHSDPAKSKLMRFLMTLANKQQVNPVIEKKTIEAVVDELIESDKDKKTNNRHQFTIEDSEYLYKDNGLTNCGLLTRGAKNHRNYQFLHLTFQEFLIAKQLAYWIKKSDARTIAPVRENKYTSSYRRIWPFVAGLLGGEDLDRLLALLLAPSRSLTSAYQDVDLILSTLDGATLNQRRFETKEQIDGPLGQLQKILDDWLAWDMKRRESPSKFETEGFFAFVGLYAKVFRSNGRKAAVCEEAERGNKRALSLASKLRFEVVQSLPKKSIVNLSRESNLDETEQYFRCVLDESWMCAWVLSYLPRWLRSGNEVVRWYALAMVIRRDLAQLPVPDFVMQEIPKLLNDVDKYVRWKAIEIVSRLFPANYFSLEKLQELLVSESTSERTSALKIASRQSDVPDSILKQLPKLLTDESFSVRAGAFRLIHSKYTFSCFVKDALSVGNNNLPLSSSENIGFLAVFFLRNPTPICFEPIDTEHLMMCWATNRFSPLRDGSIKVTYSSAKNFQNIIKKKKLELLDKETLPKMERLSLPEISEDELAKYFPSAVRDKPIQVSAPLNICTVNTLYLSAQAVGGSGSGSTDMSNTNVTGASLNIGQAHLSSAPMNTDAAEPKLPPTPLVFLKSLNPSTGDIKMKIIADNRPSRYEYAVLSQAAYNGVLDKGSTIDLPNWQVKHCQTGVNDFRALIFENKETKQLVVSYKGTNSLKSLFEDMVGIIQSDQSAQKQAAFELVSDIINGDIALPEGYQLSFTGHSLGAFLASLSVYYAHTLKADWASLNAVVFECPGLQASLEKIKSHHKSIALSSLDVVNYVTYPNIVNTFDCHAGETIYRMEVDLGSWGDWSGFYTKAAHSIGGIVNYLKEAEENPGAHPIEYMADWPVNGASVMGGERGYYFDQAKFDRKTCHYELATDRFSSSASNSERFKLNKDKSKLLFEGHYGVSSLSPTSTLALRHFNPGMGEFLRHFYLVTSAASEDETLMSMLRAKAATAEVPEAILNALLGYELRVDATGYELITVPEGTNVEDFRRVLSIWLADGGRAKAHQLLLNPSIQDDRIDIVAQVLAPGSKVSGQVINNTVEGLHINLPQGATEQDQLLAKDMMTRLKATVKKIEAYIVAPGAIVTETGLVYGNEVIGARIQVGSKPKNDDAASLTALLEIKRREKSNEESTGFVSLKKPSGRLARPS